MQKQYKLDKDQRKAVYCEDGNTLIVAAPGAGKTTVIINRVYHLIKNRGIDYRNIIVITFTKAAAENMKQRYKKLSDDGRVPFFGTFHGLFYKILRNYIDIKLIETKEAYGIVKKVLVTYMDEISEEKIKETLSTISLVKTSRNIEIEAVVKIDKDIFLRCYESYENYKKSKGLMDFDDLQIKILELFQEDERILNNYRNLFKHILVDEFQDCDGIQLEILLLLNKANSVYAVGDEDQCIYGFRGSKPQCMVNFNETFNGGKKLYLSTNYRSNYNIVDTSMKLIEHNKERNKKVVEAFKTSKGEIEVSRPYDENIQGEEIAISIAKKVVDNSASYKDFAVLYRTNNESRAIIDAFLRKNIPFYLLDKEYNFFDHFIIKDVIAYLRLAIDQYDKESFLRIINKPFRYFSKVSLEKVRSYSYKEDVFELLKKDQNIKTFQLKVIDNLKRDIQGLNKKSLQGAIYSIINELNYGEFLTDYAAKFKIPVEEVMDIVNEFQEATKNITSILKLLDHIREYSEALENNKNKSMENEDKVILSTIHGVKGMEFKEVAIINCVEDSIPHKNADNVEEERRLFYVAITRAINNLYLYVPRNVKGKFREPSFFIEQCRINLNKKIDIPYKVGQEVVHNVFGKGTIKYCDAERIDIIFDKGMERSFKSDIVINNNLLK
ncbi:ATP-dependent helicase [Clostridium cellulovorans]|uniref:DNA 3'-5' helicase n=2 Tax=Clostridium cellulovorans TaxID=1493 RepID=D9SX10_CLOC7|nr:ATP-dependent helicase [Clostridium cellulovorans]ADL51371.1 UvrD/REP helicase [Clostridium cellulovorans 743B]